MKIKKIHRHWTIIFWQLSFSVRYGILVIKIPFVFDVCNHIARTWFRSQLNNIRASTIAPFLILVHDHQLLDDDFNSPTFSDYLPHERIHVRQMWETLILPWYCIYFSGIVYNFFFLKMDIKTAYMTSIFEREAYLFEQHPDYLKMRSRFNWIHLSEPTIFLLHFC